MAEPNEPRALTAALANPTFATRAGGLAMHAANRHVERWAPETATGVSRSRPLRNLGFVDRLVSPWLEAAQRSASLRILSGMQSGGMQEHQGNAVSWVFPRPWYQDELDWMAASRQVGTQAAMVGDREQAPSMLTTRGTYVAPTQARESSIALPAALYEYVAPSLSIARPELGMRGDAYSPLVSSASTQAAHVMSRVVAPMNIARMSPNLRSVLTTMLERTARQGDEVGPTRLASNAPELVTPPAPRPVSHDSPADHVVNDVSAQRVQIAELQRAARVVTEREFATRLAAEARPAQPSPSAIEERIAERDRGTRRLHEQARDAAARDVRSTQPERAERQVPHEIVAAIAALPPELASMLAQGIGQRPDRAVAAIGELGEALRTVELLARNTASGGSFESSRGPRLVMPTGLGGLVSTVDRASAITPTVQRPHMRMPSPSWLTGPSPASPTTALGATAASSPAALQHVAWADRWLARFSGARGPSLDLLTASASTPETRMQALAAAAPGTVFVSPMFDATSDARVTSRAIEAATASVEAARDPAAMPAITTPSSSAVRYDDSAETPDDVFTAISAAVARTRGATPGAPQPDSMTMADLGRESMADLVARGVPTAPGAGISAQLGSSPFAPAFRHMFPLASSPSFDVRALLGGGLGATYLAGLLSPAMHELHTDDAPAREVDWQPEYVAAREDAPAATDDATAPLTTLRSALLSWDVETLSAPSITSTSSATARSMVDAMSMPMLDSRSTELDNGSYAAPGMLADRAHGWSVEQERSSADLAYDFVTPELVLAARVYGLGPAEAAQAARLASGGPSHLGAMASAVDRTFVQAMAIEAERRQTLTAYPREIEAGSRDEAGDAPSRATHGSSQTFGVARRLPRGAFMWPSATIAALGLSAATPDGDHSMSVAALELLAAQSVAELGTYAALGFERPAEAQATSSSAATATNSATEHEREPTEDVVLATATAMVPTIRRAKFEAMYLALGQSSSGRSASPSSRAARALALAGRGDDTISAHERASIAWDVMPVIAPMDADGTVSTGAAVTRARTTLELPQYVESRPGLAGLSARAGEALGSYVTPAASSSSSSSSSSSQREQGAVLRAPTAAQEFVNTGSGSGGSGRSAGRYGGGEVEIPNWFEAAARKMLEERSGNSDGISLAELTLVTAAPPAQIAASTRGVPSSAPANPNPSSGNQATGSQQIDVEKVANEVYKQILVLMDAARGRNGEPYL